MKNLNSTPYTMLLICFTLIVGCGNGNTSKTAVEAPIDNSIPIEDSTNRQGSNHTYNITIKPTKGKERQLTGEINNFSEDDGTGNNFSVYSNTPNGKGIVLRIGNDDLIINGLFFHNNNGTTADLSEGSEDDSEELSNLILTIKPPSNDILNGVSGNITLSNIKYAFENEAGGALGYSLVFEGEFEDYDGNNSEIKGTVEVQIPNYL